MTRQKNCFKKKFNRQFFLSLKCVFDHKNEHKAANL